MVAFIIPALVGLGSMLLGGATGKVAQMHGDSKVDDANRIIANTNKFIEEQKELCLGIFIDNRDKLSLYVWLIEKFTSGTLPAREDRIPPDEIAAFLEQIMSPWLSESATKPGSESIFRLTPQRYEAIRQTMMTSHALNKIVPNSNMGQYARNAGGILWGVSYASNGVNYAINSSSQLERVSSWSRETKTHFAQFLEKLRSDLARTESMFKGMILPSLEKAATPPIDDEKMAHFARMAITIQKVADAYAEHIKALASEIK